MSFVKKGKSSKRNYDKEADLQVKILEQKSREDYLMLLSEDSTFTPDFGHAGGELQQSYETDTKACIPKNAKEILEKWMYDHRLYCYPSKCEKQALSLATGLSVQKISNWFINSRRRTLPKVLEMEGKSADDFTISRKKKNRVEAAATTTVSNYLSTFNDFSSLADYANQEESKIIDQSNIFYGDDFNAFDSMPQNGLQELAVPHIEPYTENLQSSYQAMAEKIQKGEKEEKGHNSNWLNPAKVKSQQASEPQSSSLHAVRGILYDQATKSKCLFILIDSPD